MNKSEVIALVSSSSESEAHCSQCSLNTLCLPAGLDKKELDKLDGLVESAHTLKEGEILFRQEEDFVKLYAVRSGTFKSTLIDKSGNEKIVEFYLPGELIGLDAIYQQNYKTNVIALDTASVCPLPYDQLTHLSGDIPSLQQQLLRLMSKEINDMNMQIMDFGIEQRLAAFVYSLSVRYRERGYSSTHIHLAMPRQDIANHLNMAPETISRLFKRMQKDGIFTLNRRDLIIEDMNKLMLVAGCDSIT